MSTTKTPILPGQTYHLYNHANTYQDLFKSEENYQYFLRRFAHYMLPFVDVYAYCLMPNHFHFLVRIKELEEFFSQSSDLSERSELWDSPTYTKKVTNALKNWMVSYTNSFNKMYGFKGNLFRQKTRRKRVEDEKYFIDLIKYIHLNPVSHCFVEYPEDWQFSSYSGILSGEESFIDKETIMHYFDDLKNFKLLHNLRFLEKFVLDMD